MNNIKENLRTALEHAESSRACISENRGYDKELARDSYEACVNEDLFSVLKDALEDIDDPKVIERIAKFVFKQLMNY